MQIFYNFFNILKFGSKQDLRIEMFHPTPLSNCLKLTPIGSEEDDPNPFGQTARKQSRPCRRPVRHGQHRRLRVVGSESLAPHIPAYLLHPAASASSRCGASPASRPSGARPSAAAGYRDDARNMVCHTPSSAWNLSIGNGS